MYVHVRLQAILTPREKNEPDLYHNYDERNALLFSFPVIDDNLEDFETMAGDCIACSALLCVSDGRSVSYYSFS